MTPEQRRGQVICLVIALVVVGLNLLSFLATVLVMPKALAIQSVFLVVASVIAWCVFRGYSWARNYAAVSLFLGGLYQVLAAVFTANPIVIVVTLFFAAPLIVASVVLWTSKAVEAYCDRQAEARDDTLSLTGLNE